jgi:hypothetical protein
MAHGGEQVEELNLGADVEAPLSSQSCKSCTACALPCSARSSLSNPHSAPCALQAKTHDERHLRYPFKNIMNWPTGVSPEF